MSRKGSTQKSTAGQNKTSARTNKQAAVEEKEYDDEYPPLSTGASTVVTPNKSSVTKLDQPAISDENQQAQTTASSENSESSVKENKRTVWKAPPKASQQRILFNFVSESPTPKHMNTDRHQPAGRSSTRYPMPRRSQNEGTSNQGESIDKMETKLYEIILSIHLRQEFVSVERVERELLTSYGVESFRELGVYPRDLKPVKNLIQRVKDVTFYMQVFEQIFNLCTLHDLGPLVARFLKVDTYEDARLGPLDEHPDVKRVFKYKPTKRHQPIPQITSGQIISAFVTFQEKYPGRSCDYDRFIDELVQQNNLQKREELGLFCRSFPYLTEVTKTVARELKRYKKRIDSDAQKRIITTVEAQLWEIQQEVSDELSSYTNKSPVAVFDHLVSVVDKHLTVAQQKSVRDTLLKIRNDELLRCLLNISIYLGTIDKPEKFIDQIKKLNQNQITTDKNQDSSSTSKSLQTNKAVSNKQQHKSSVQYTDTTSNISSIPIETSFGSSNSSSYSNKPQVPVKQLCNDLFKILIRYDTILTIKQLFDIKKNLCNNYSMRNFAEFGINDDDDDDNISLDMISFLYKYRENIDPRGELSIYENVSSTGGDRQEIYSFVNQLSIVNSWREKQQQDEYTTTRDIALSKSQLSAVEKAVQHKFAGLMTNNRVLQIIKKAKNQYSKKTHTIIHFEESLLDEVSLNQLGICPPSLLVDESQLCEIILQCPVMYDLSTWLQWSHLFQSRHGALKTFIARKSEQLDRLLLLETSNHELFRLPTDYSIENFEKELNQGNVRSSVGHLCALIICEYVQVNQLPFTIYRQIITTWLIRLRSSAQLQSNQVEPMQYVLEFLTYLPSLIGQSRIVQELILDPVDEVFGNDEDNQITDSRERIWILANGKQKSKLEMWAYILDINEWKNESKWQGIEQVPQEVYTQPLIVEAPKPTIIQTDATVPIQVVTAPVVSVPSTPAVVERPVPAKIIDITVDETDVNYAAFEHIKKIREGFGVDNSLDATGQSIVNNLQGMVERSLEKLSNDLYSEQGHFVLELIQNADDNQYPSDRLPTLRFVVSSDSILVCNNETGFQPNNIDAICNIGKSTKGKHKQGYTGHKGIGFKSVFMVSHRPEIHSGNYHFCFDTMNGTEQIGYIRPIWLENYDEVLSTINEWKTCIRLPIKEEKRGDRLKRNFDDIHARLLLFLNRLRQIEIVRQKGNNETDTQIFTRIDHAQGQIIELQKKILTSSSEKLIKNFWLVKKAVIYVPDTVKRQLSDVKCEVESTIIAIAYPLDNIQEGSSYQILSAQPVFAYLPLRSYGFHFILQGDFEIPASRQEILRDNVWNEWLKKEMVKLIPLAYDSFKNLPEIISSCSLDVQQHIGSLNLIQTLKYFIKMLPIRNDINPYFNSFTDKTIQSLMGTIQLPISRDNNIQWISPTQSVIVRDSFIRQIFSQELLLSHFNNYYLDEQFINECDETILIKLGCRRLDFSNILKLIRTLYTQNQQEHSTKTTSIEQIAQWFLCIDYSLQQERENPGFNLDDNEHNEKTTMDQLKQMKIIPLKDQTRLVSIEEFNQRTILFPLDKSTQFEKHLKIVLEDLPTIDHRLIEYIENKYPRRLESIKRLLKGLGISESRNVRRIYSNHILPILSDDIQWSAKSDTILIAYLIFIYKELYSNQPEQFANEIEKLKTKLIVKTGQGTFIRINSNGNIVHLTSLYGCKKSLDLLNLSKQRFTFISDDYHNQYRSEIFYQDGEKHRFISFLTELDIQDFFLVKRIDNGFINIEQLVGTQWEHIIGVLSSLIFEPFTIQDYRSDEFDEFINPKNVENVNQYIEILLYLDHYHPALLPYYSASVIKSRERHMGTPVPIQGVESSFCLSLRNHSWIPVTNDQLFKPTDVYFLPPNNPFRRYFPCLDAVKVPLKNPNFINLLGFKQQVMPMTMFELFMKWSCNLDQESLHKLINETNNQPQNPIPCPISTKLRQSCRDTFTNISQIYKFLASDNEIRALIGRFRLWPIVFIPRTNDTGDFLFVHEVFWEDPDGLLTNANPSDLEMPKYITLQTYYGKDTFSKQFFTLLLQVKPEPTLDDYLSLLNILQNQKSEYIWKYIKLITRLAFAQNKQSLVKDKCVNCPLIPCLGNEKKLVRYSDKPYYPHDIDIANLFADTLLIINLPGDLIDSSVFKQHFCSLFDIEDFADFIKILVEVDNPQPATDLQNFYSHSIDLIQHALIINGSLSESRSSHLQSVFADLNFVLVDSIHLSYQYRENLVCKAPSSSNPDSYIDEVTRKFYISQYDEKSDSRYRHIETLVNYLILDKSARPNLSQCIRNLFKIYQNKGIQALLDQQKQLPEEKLPKWIIPQVIEKKSNSSLTEDDQDEEEQEDETNNEPIVIPPEMLEKMKNEPALELPKPKAKIITDPNQPKSITCFPPMKASTDDHIPSDPIKPTSELKAQLNNDTKPKETTPVDTQIANKDHPNTTVPSTTASASKTNDSTDQTNQNNTVKQSGTNPTNRPMEEKDDSKSSKTNKSAEQSTQSNSTSLTIGDFTATQPRINFEHVRISNFNDIVLAPSKLPNPPTTSTTNAAGNETDYVIGRRGEEFVYRYLQWKYPNAQIQWINEQQESGKPYDIQMTRKENKNQPDFIEVKTTRISKQNTFLISIAEVESLLENPDNYYIYRVYYSNDEKSSTITILSQIKCHLQQKQLALSITIPEKLDEQ